MAGRTSDPQLKAALLLRQAELSDDLDAQADLYWQVYQSGQLPENQFDPAYRAWNAAKQPERVIEAAEQWLRSGKPLSRQTTALADLVTAYRAVGRDRDAQRAATSDPEPPASGPPAPNNPRRREQRGAGLW